MIDKYNLLSSLELKYLRFLSGKDYYIIMHIIIAVQE